MTFNGREIIFIALSFAAVFVIFYAALPSKGYYDDDMYYAGAVEKGDVHNVWLSSPHHFLWSYSGLALFKLAALFGYRGRSIAVLEFLNAVFACVGLFLFYAFQRKILVLGAAASFWSSIVLAFSFGFWNSAVSASAYCLEAVLLIPVLFLASGMATTGARATSRWCGLCLGLALINQTVNVMLLPLVGAYVLFMRARSPGRFRNLAACALTAIAVAAVSTLCVGLFLQGVRSIGSFCQWFFGPYGMKDYLYLHPGNALMMLLGNFRALWGIAFVKAYLLGRGAIGAHAICGILCAVGNAALLAYFAAFLARWRSLDAARRGFVVFGLAWIAMYSVFFAFYSPGQPKFYVRNLIPAASLVGIAYDMRSRQIASRPWVIVVAVVCLWTVNLVGTILPQSVLANNDDSLYARFVIAHTEPGSVVIFPGGGETSTPVQVEYFGARTVYGLRSELKRPDDFDRNLRQAISSGVPCYLVEEERRVASYRFYGPLRDRVRHSSLNADVAREFFAKRGYRLEPYLRYNEATDYCGNALYTVIAK
jgi:hypothetical protein